MLKRKQIVVIGLVVVLMGLLLSLDIKGLVKKEGQAGGATPNNSSNSVLTIERISEAARQGLNANLAQQIGELEQALKSAPASQKLELQKQLAQKWDDVNQPAPSALYYEAVAQQEYTYANWLKAGDFFTTAYQSNQDTLLQQPLTQKATASYRKALELQPNSLDARTGLGAALVNDATSNPMQGIQLLLAVIKEDPKNIKANMNLGLFSMKSGQYDKAITRFKTVIEQKPDPESWFYLAASYENMGMKPEAIAAYEKSKELAADPRLTKFIDQKVKELSK